MPPCEGLRFGFRVYRGTSLIKKHPSLGPYGEPIGSEGAANALWIAHLRGFALRVQGLWFMVYGLGFWVKGLGFGVWGVGCRV